MQHGGAGGDPIIAIRRADLVSILLPARTTSTNVGLRPRRPSRGSSRQVLRALPRQDWAMQPRVEAGPLRQVNGREPAIVELPLALVAEEARAGHLRGGAIRDGRIASAQRQPRHAFSQRLGDCSWAVLRQDPADQRRVGHARKRSSAVARFALVKIGEDARLEGRVALKLERIQLTHTQRALADVPRVLTPRAVRIELFGAQHPPQLLLDYSLPVIPGEGIHKDVLGGLVHLLKELLILCGMMVVTLLHDDHGVDGR
mmetsp:Transcript_12665/g.21459  ORF Transcript_12665/g.21459 Transcript_12665/m.21459 type:complete len:258 (-) Transcript_12665:454-1227(-)